MRTVLALFLATAVVAAADRDQIEWSSSLKDAFKEARASGRPVMVCINAKEGESANERAATKTYRHPEFVALSRKFAMVVISVRTHGSGAPCARFGKIRCKEHRNCYLELKQDYRRQFVVPGTDGEMISPQHAWFEPDGTLLVRKEYEMSRAELQRRMKQVLQEVKRAASKKPPEGQRTGGQSGESSLSDKERVQMRRVRTGDREIRRSALDNLLGGRKDVVTSPLLALADTAANPLLRDLLRAFGRAKSYEAVELVERSLTHKSPGVRSAAAVALERIQLEESVSTLIKISRAERDPTVKKNLYRALGACGGKEANKAAARELLKGMRHKDKVLAKHAVLAMAHYKGDASKLVLKKLEKAARSKKTTEFHMRGLAYTLERIGDRKTTTQALRAALERTRDKGLKTQIKNAIDHLLGKETAMDYVPDAVFWEDRADDAREA